jgi:hypothetical protein
LSSLQGRKKNVRPSNGRQLKPYYSFFPNQNFTEETLTD